MADNFYVYKIENKLNGMKYVGSTCVSPKARWSQHIGCAFKRHDHHWNYPLMRAFREFGVENFNFDVVCTCSDYEDMIRTEQKYIDFYNCKVPNGYNQTRQTTTPAHDENVVNRMKERNRKKLGVKICEITKEGKIIKRWDSLAECSDDTGIIKNDISRNCHGGTVTCHGRYFRLLDDNDNLIKPARTERANTIGKKITQSLIKRLSKEIAELDDNGNVIGKWNSIKEASIATGCDGRRISDVCRGCYPKYKGRMFAYINQKTTYTVYCLLDNETNRKFYGVLSSEVKLSAVNIFKNLCTSKCTNSVSLITDFLAHNIQPYTVHTLSNCDSIEDANEKLNSILNNINEKCDVYNFDNLVTEDYLDIFDKCSKKIDKVTFRTDKNFVNVNAKPIVQFDSNGKEIARFSSVKEAATLTGLNLRRLSKCANRKANSYHNCYWRFANDIIEGEFEKIGPIKPPTSKINRIDENGNVLETFNSIREACIKYNLFSPAVSDVCRGKQKTTKGFIFEYAK